MNFPLRWKKGSAIIRTTAETTYNRCTSVRTTTSVRFFSSAIDNFRHIEMNNLFCLCDLSAYPPHRNNDGYFPAGWKPVRESALAGAFCAYTASANGNNGATMHFSSILLFLWHGRPVDLFSSSLHARKLARMESPCVEHADCMRQAYHWSVRNFLNYHLPSILKI